MKLCLALIAAGGSTVAAAEELPASLQYVLDLARDSPEELFEHIMQSPLSKQVRPMGAESNLSAPMGAALPTVMGHGMGDSCFNAGFKSVTNSVGARTGSYAVCIPTGNNVLSDTINGFLLNMDASIDVFAEKIKADPQLAGGFNAMGFSQGNSLIRGYIQKYNDPPVRNFVSVHGTVMGVAAFPSCFQQGKPLGLICKIFAELLGALAYNPLVQDILFQANYLRVATDTDGSSYLQNSQIAQWNNERVVDTTIIDNFNAVDAYGMVKALGDSMVYPNEGQWWGSLPDGTYGDAQEMKDTKFYQQNLFGLKDADEAGKISYETTTGDHLEFSDAELYAWVDKYFLGGASSLDIHV